MSSLGAHDEALDEIVRAYRAELAQGTEHSQEATLISFQYEVAKAQVRWALIFARIAVASVVVAIPAVIVAATK